jgi:hypothetical protein
VNVEFQKKDRSYLRPLPFFNHLINNNNYFFSALLLSIATTPIPAIIVMKMIIPHSSRVGIPSEGTVVLVVGIVVVTGTVVVISTEVVVVIGSEVVVVGTVVVVKAEVVVGFPGFVVACARTISGIERVKIYMKRIAQSITSE